MVSNAVSMNASTYQHLFAGGTGALYIPVNPNAVVYSQFSHVHGIAASAGQRGVPVSRVKILDTLINQLVSMKNKPSLSKDDVLELSDAQKDMLIKNYQDQINTAVKMASTAGTYGFAGLLPEPGAIFSISA